jgi:hypothetical protein
MTTPEGSVKAKVKLLLAQFKPQLYAHWAVQNGMGEPTLDCNGAVNGVAFSIECKAPGKSMTPRQEQTAIKMRLAGVTVFEVDGSAAGMSALRMWLEYWFVRKVIEQGL